MLRKLFVVMAAHAALLGAAMAQSPLTTGEPNNGRSSGQPGAFFDLHVGSDPLTITSWDYYASSTAGTPTEVSIFIKEGSYVGFDTDPTAWTLHGTAAGVSEGLETPLSIDPPDLRLNANTTYGIYFRAEAGGLRYRGSTGVPPTIYETNELAFEGGIVRADPFGGSLFDPRLWSGSIHYNVGSAGGVSVAIVAAAATTTPSAAYTETQRVIAETGLFDAVDVIALTTGAGTPTLAELQQYDAVLVWTNSTPDDNELLGDRLADYVDAGGGVVVAVFANSTTTSGRDIGGRWRGSAEYEVIIPRSGNQSGAASLGTVLDPTHPIMDGVSTFFGGTSSFRPNVTNLHPGATAIARWDDGRVLAAVGANPRRVDLGFYPPPSTVSTSLWDIRTDGDLLMANALLFAAGGGGGTVCYADCDGSGELDFFDFLCFQTAFAAGDPYADCDGSGKLDFFDFLCFQNAFTEGCLQLSLSEYGTSAPPASDCGTRLTQFPLDPRGTFVDVTTVPSPLGGNVTFDIACSIRQVGLVGWATWSHGYTGSVYYTDGAAVLNVGPPANSAFYLYVQPNPFSVIEFEITGEAGSEQVSVIDSIDGASGAKGFGFCGGVANVNVRTTDGMTDFAVGEFGIAN